MQRQNIFEVQNQERRSRTLETHRRGKELLAEKAAAVVEASANREARGIKCLAAVQQLVRFKVLQAIQKRENKTKDQQQRVKAVQELHNMKGVMMKHKNLQRVANSGEDRRAATMVPKSYSPGPGGDSQRIGRIHRPQQKEYADWSWAKDMGEASVRRSRKSGKRSSAGQEARKPRVAGLTSPRTANILQRLGLRPGFWSMLESACAPLMAPEIEGGEAVGPDAHWSLDLPEDQEPLEPDSPKADEARSADVAFLTEAGTSISGEAGLQSKGFRPRHQTKKGKIQSSDGLGKGAELVGDSTASHGAASPVYSDADSDFNFDVEGEDDIHALLTNEEEALAEFDQQLTLYFDCMRKEDADK